MPEKRGSNDQMHNPDPEQIKNLLLVLEHARADAWLRRNLRALEALLAPAYLEINMLGRFTRNETLIQLFPRVEMHTFTIEAPALLYAGKEAASLTYQCYEEFTVDGKRRKGTFYVSALYLHEGKQWKLALWQITPVTGS